MVYAFSRYAVLVSNTLSVLTAYPLSDSVSSNIALISCSGLIFLMKRYLVAFDKLFIDSYSCILSFHSCTAIGWSLIVVTILSTIAFSGVLKASVKPSVY